jgi:hypothetical protein
MGSEGMNGIFVPASFTQATNKDKNTLTPQNYLSA